MTEPIYNHLLGKSARDVITGFEGVISGVCYYLTGCAQVVLLPRELDKDGDTRASRWYDVGRLEILDEPAVELVDAPKVLGDQEDSGSTSESKAGERGADIPPPRVT